jgi:hypothetical protein
MKTNLVKELQERIEFAKSDAKRYNEKYNEFKNIESAIEYSIAFLEKESESVSIEDETDYEPYKYDYVKSLFEHQKDVKSDKERFQRWLAEKNQEIEILNIALKNLS